MSSSNQGQGQGPTHSLNRPTLAASSSAAASAIRDRARDDSDLSDIDLPTPSSPSPDHNPPSSRGPLQQQHRPRVIHSSPIASPTSSPASPPPRPLNHHRATRSPSLSSSDVSSIPPSSPVHDPMDVDDDDSLHVDDNSRRKPPRNNHGSGSSSQDDSDHSADDHDHMSSRGRSRVRRPRSSASDASSDPSSVRLSSLSASPTATPADPRQKMKSLGAPATAREDPSSSSGAVLIRRRITSSSSSMSSVSSVGTLSSSSSRSSSPPSQGQAARKQRLAPLPIHARKDGNHGGSDSQDDDGGSSSGDSDKPVAPGSRSGVGSRRVLPSSPDSPMDHKAPTAATAAAAIKQEPGTFKSKPPKKDPPKSSRPAPLATTTTSRVPASTSDPTETPLTSPLLPKRRGSTQATTSASAPPLTNVDARKDTSGRTRLFKAVSRGDFALVTSLVAAGANVNHKDHAGWTPLHEAVLARHEAIVQVLLERGANPNAQGLHGNTPLHDADTEEYLPVARMLLKYGASVSVRNEDGVAPVENPEAEDEVSALLNAYGVLEDALLRRDRWGMTLLHRCCWELGQKRDPPGSSAAAGAAEWLRPSPELIQELVACRRVDVNVSDNAGWTPLHELVAQQRVPLVQLLLRHGADVNARGFRGMTPLHEAAKGKGHAELVRLLLDHGADPRAATDGAGVTPIDVCDDTQLKQVMAEYPYRATRADEVRRQLLEEIARTSGGVHGDWQSGSAAAGPGAGAGGGVPVVPLDTAETVLSDPGGGGGGAQDESKSERSRDDAASTSTHQQRSGASYGGGAGGGDPRKMTREERLMASYIARIERQEQRKQQQQQQSQQGGKAAGAGEGSSGGAKRKKSSATSVDIGKAAEKAVEKTAAAAAAGPGRSGDDHGARESTSGGAAAAASSGKTKAKESSRKASVPGSSAKSRESPAPSTSVRETAIDKSRAASASTRSSKAQQSADPSSSTADGDQRPAKKRAKTSSSATAVPDPSVRVDDLPQYCTTGDATRVAKALSLPGVITVLPKAILAASRAGHVELVRVVVDRLAAAHASGAANAPANLSGGKPVLSVQQVVTAALHQAVKQEHVDVAGYLLSKGAKATARNRAGQTPIEQARALGNKVLVSLLEQAASGLSSGFTAAGFGGAGGGSGGRGGAGDDDSMMVDDKMTVVVTKDSVVLATKSSKGGAGASSTSSKRKAAAVKMEVDDLSDTDVDSDTAPPPPKKAKTTGSMSRDRARESKQHQQPAQHSSSLLSSLGFKDPPSTQDLPSSQHNRAVSSNSQRTTASRRNSSSSTPLLANSQLPPSAADRRRASLLEQGGESGGNSPEISVVDSPRRAQSTIGPLSSSTSSPILAIQFGTRFLVLEPDVRGHVSVPSAGQVFRAPSQREIFALMDSPVASSLRPGLPPPRIAMLDELVAAVHAAGTGPLPVQFTSWRPPSSSSPPPPPPPPKRARAGRPGSSGKQTAPGLTTPTQSPSSHRNKRRPPTERVLPPKVMFKYMQRRASASNASSAK